MILKWQFILLATVAIAVFTNETGATREDLLTPEYYVSGESSPFREEVDGFLFCVRQERFHHPLANEAGETPAFNVPANGVFEAGRGPGGTAEYHGAVDLHVGNQATAVDLFAAHDGVVSTFRDAPRYRHYVAITKTVENCGQMVGKLVTIYAHIDLDLDEADTLFLDGQYVSKGDLVSRNLYANTVGGPHVHFEVRYYRPGDVGDERFYGSPFGPGGGNPDLTEPSAGPWSFGFWNPGVGYGHANPQNHVALVPELPGDLDIDGDADIDDFALFVDCVAGPGVTMLPPGVDPAHFDNADLDDDGDVDMADFARFQIDWADSQ